MSEEVVRNYTWGGSLRRRRRDLRRRTTGVAKIMLPIILIILAWGFWITRDNYGREGFIPADAQVEVYMDDVVARKAKLAENRLISLAPEGSDVQIILESITGDIPVPEWIINNLSGDVLHLYSPSIAQMNELVATSHMTRIGCIVERFMRFTANVQKDYAGGLQLRFMPDIGLYYAVRGRVLLLSQSRESLIQALTLRQDAALPTEQFMDGFQKAKGADVLCVLKADAVDMAVKPFEQIEVALRLETDSILAAVNGNISRKFIEEHAPFLANITPQPLDAPFEGMVSASMNFGMPLRDILDAVDESLPALEVATDFIKGKPNDTDTVASIGEITTLLQQALRITGAKTRLVWTGVDAYEMLPAPFLAAAFEADADAALALFERVVPSNTVNEDIDLTLRLDEEHLVAYSPVIGGESIEPAVASYGNGLIVSSSALMAKELVKSPAATKKYSESGNLYLSIKPHSVAESLLNAAREFAISGLLRGYTVETLEASAKPLLYVTSQINSFACLASCNQGIVQASIKLDMAKSDVVVPAPAPTDGGDNGQE